MYLLRSTLLLLTAIPQSVVAQRFWDFDESCGPFELSTAEGYLQRLPNGTVTVQGLSNASDSDDDSESFYLLDNGILSRDPSSDVESCGFFDFWIPGIYLNCYPNHILEQNYDLTFRIDQSGRLNYRDNSTFYICRQDILGYADVDTIKIEMEDEYLILPGNIDDNSREIRTVSNCQTTEIRASSCHGFLSQNRTGGEEGDSKEAGGGDNGETSSGDNSNSESSNASRIGGITILATVLVFWSNL